ncbi:MAG TPA: AAA family ATPase [Vicinamibacterales bacterium]|nr:AAA family ATPase [Vicinamibacterales bacterium]
MSPLAGGLLEAVRAAEFPMHEEYFGFTEKPFSLTPDPKYLYRSASHGSAFELLQYAIRRREGFVVVTGDIGTGKTTLCRAVLDQLDRRTFTALVLNPFLSEEDLLRAILQDFGVVSREEMKRGRLAGVSKQELIETLNEFLLSLLPLGAAALLIIDEAQNLPLQTLEQIRILSNLETDKEKLLQIVLVGQPNLKDMLRSSALRQLDQRISIRFELKPLTAEETAAYIGHRLTIAGGGSIVQFVPRAMAAVYRYSGGIPRLINLLCDRALLGAYGERTNRVTAAIVKTAAASLELQPARRSWAGLRRRWVMLAGALVLVATATAAGHGRMPLRGITPAPAAPAIQQETPSGMAGPLDPPAMTVATTASAEPPALAPAPATKPGRFSVLVASFREPHQAATLVTQLRELGFPVRNVRVVSGANGTWHQVLAGPYADLDAATADERRVRQMPGYRDAHVTGN